MKQLTQYLNVLNQKTKEERKYVVFNNIIQVNMNHINLERMNIVKDKIELKQIYKFENELKDKTILITGGAGSIGEKICENILKFDVKKVICLDINELSLSKCAGKFSNEIERNNIELKLGSVLDFPFLESICKKYNPDIIIHAAAYKHVDIAEDNPEIVIKYNIQGTLNILELCEQFKIQRMVFLSSDKAINPSSIMGVTKRIGELLVKSYKVRLNGKYSIVRFGNVFGSSGSVVEIFERNIKNDKKIEITHPDMKRYFMTLNDAANLAIVSIAMCDEGDIFIADMKELIKICDLAKKIILAMGYKENEIEISYTNIRKGESLFEEVNYSNEILRKSSVDNIMVCDMKYEKEIDVILKKVFKLMEDLYSNDLINYILAIVPEYKKKKNL